VFVLKHARPDFVDHLSRAHHGHAPAAPPTGTGSDVAALPAATTLR
jgi:hypothetical protein